MARKLAAVAFSLGCFHASSLMALGLGEIQLDSFLNQPLNASVDLLNMGVLHEDEIKVRLATTEDFDKLGLDRAYFLTNITFEVVSDGRGGARIQMRSEEPVLEPYLDFIVEARWPSGRLLREYTVLIDPPVFSQSTPVVSASERVAATEGIPAPTKDSESFSYNYEERRNRVGDSNAAADAMPQRGYNASTQSTPTPGSRFTIRRDQTLWEIASRAKPAGVSVHQTMLDIQRLNPDAFINGNINRIKAGYIIYLPTAEDISSADLPTALAKVREQNAVWRDERGDASRLSRGPSLRISAEPDAVSVEAETQRPAGSQAARAEETAQPSGTDRLVGAGSVSADTLERLVALEQQLETLQRIVSLKDDQIAALQDALKDAGGAVVEVAPEEVAVDIAPVPADLPLAGEEGQTEAAQVEPPDDVSSATNPEQIDEQVAANAQAKKPQPTAVAKTPAAETPDTTTEESWTSYLLYALGALLLAIAGFVFARRNSVEKDESLPARSLAPTEDVFADVRLQDQILEVEAAVEEPTAVEKSVVPTLDNRGYGVHKHDEYASDVDAADALAEADIYIAYGRHPQAIDLLDNALAAEPGNPVYRLKLLEIYTELDNQSAAMAQLQKIMEIGDPDSIARAEAMIEGLGVDEIDELELPSATANTPVDRGPGLSPNPLNIFNDSDETLEEVFSGLEIEEEDDVGEEDDLDLSTDFTDDNADAYDDEELVIAADSNAFSTKLDLARAYLDMGDDDGARQILDEVVAEGSEELKAEAQTLLDRIG
tara:strand:- start:16109 stop:18427 length:2319 start_codon:yes stop_codon:yes gene_type:complete